MNINDKIIQAINILYYSGKTIRDSRWQSVETSLYMYEVNNLFFKAPMPEEVNSLAFQCQPDLPWSEDHFQERVGGKPLNPGNEYKNWPYYKDEIYKLDIESNIFYKVINEDIYLENPIIYKLKSLVENIVNFY